ncbi:MAG: helix-turn-helix domain-containing protein [Planctomycetota bacterium]|nr:helix-turn-helix domain-containing protein [Planctomycetota bacterium]
MAEEYLDFAQALEALEITETELWELIHSGTLKAYRAGGVIKFKKSDIIAYQKSRGTEPTIVVSRKMLSEDDEGDDEEGVDTEVGLRAARRPSKQDDMATSEITAKEEPVRRRRPKGPRDAEGDTEETAPVDSVRSRRTTQRTPGAGAAASTRSKRISQVLETEKKGNLVMNIIMVVAILVCLYQGLMQVGIVANEGFTETGGVVITKPAWVAQGMYDWGLKWGDSTGQLGGILSQKGLTDDYKAEKYSENTLLENFNDKGESEDGQEPPADEGGEEGGGEEGGGEEGAE